MKMHWKNRLVAAASLLSSRASSFWEHTQAPATTFPALPDTGQVAAGTASTGVHYASEAQSSSRGRSQFWLSFIPGTVIVLCGASQWASAEEIRARPSTADTSQQDVQLVEDSLRSAESGEVVSNSHTARWRIYTNMGRDLFSQGRLDEAEKYFTRALEEAKKGFGDLDPHVASSCNNLAELYRMKREFSKAEPLFLESVQRLEQVLGPMHESVGFALHNLAGTYLQQHNYEQARLCYEWIRPSLLDSVDGGALEHDAHPKLIPISDPLR